MPVVFFVQRLYVTILLMVLRWMWQERASHTQCGSKNGHSGSFLVIQEDVIRGNGNAPAGARYMMMMMRKMQR